jgi:hypothetical protein
MNLSKPSCLLHTIVLRIHEHPYSQIPSENHEVCKGACLYNEYPAIQDGQDLWGMCTISIECKTILISVLTFVSGMDPHMIR